MLNINFNEAWNDLDSLNEKKQTKTGKAKQKDDAPISCKYEDIKAFLDMLRTLRNQDDFAAEAQKINNIIDKKQELEQELGKLMSDFKKTFSTNDLTEYNKFKEFERKINSRAYRHAGMHGPRRLALIYNTYVIEHAISTETALQKQIVDLIKNSKNAEESATASLTWKNSAKEFSRATGATLNQADFTCKISGMGEINIEVKIAVFTDTIDNPFKTTHSHNAEYIVRYYPNSDSGCFVVYKRAELNDDASANFVPVGDINQAKIKFNKPDNFLDINSFPGYWPNLSQIENLDIDNTNSN